MTDKNDMKGNTRALKHGGGKALVDLTAGRPFTGAAAAAQLEVQKDYAEGGAIGMIRENAERLQAASRLYWECFLAAATAKNLDMLDSYAARFGWLASSALRAWAEIQKHEKTGKVDAGVVIDALKAGKYGDK